MKLPNLNILILFVLAGCSTVMRSPDTGFLSQGDAVVPMQANPADANCGAKNIDSRIDPVQWRVPVSGKASDADKVALCEHLGRSLTAAIARLPEGSRKNLRVRAAISDVDTVSPKLNVASALLLFLPLDRGGAAVEIEAIDLGTGKKIAELHSGYYPPMSKMRARYKRLAPAELALGELAERFADLVEVAVADQRPTKLSSTALDAP